MRNTVFSMSATNSTLLECIKQKSVQKINATIHAVNLCSSCPSGLVFGADFLCVHCRHIFPGVPNPLHQFKMIVLHIYNVSDVCGIIQGLLLKGVRQWGWGEWQFTGSCGYFLISVKLVFSQPKEQSWSVEGYMWFTGCKIDQPEFTACSATLQLDSTDT